jgi:hypothetical protein
MPPKIYTIPDHVKTPRELFLAIIDDQNAEGPFPRPTSKGAAKALYAPTAVYTDPMNFDAKRRRRRLSSAQCVRLYRDLLERGVLRVVERRDYDRHLRWTVETAHRL